MDHAVPEAAAVAKISRLVEEGPLVGSTRTGVGFVEGLVVE